MTYQYLLAARELKVNGTQVEPVDPLFLNPKARLYVPEEKGGAVDVLGGALTIWARCFTDETTGALRLQKIVDPTAIDRKDPSLMAVGPITVRVSRLPYGFALGGRSKEVPEDARQRFEIRQTRRVRAYMVPTKGSQAYLTYLDGPDTDLSPGDPVEIALGLFFFFLLNPYNEKLGGPCRHCEKYYVKKTKRQTVYCSQRCGRKYTSRISVQQRRLQEHLEIIEKANECLAKWASTNTRKRWKEWVSDNALISRHWLSRYVEKGELVVPVKSTRRKHRSDP